MSKSLYEQGVARGTHPSAHWTILLQRDSRTPDPAVKYSIGWGVRDSLNGVRMLKQQFLL